MIKVLGLALYGPLAASTRYRLEQYIPGLENMGIELNIQHLLGDDYLRSRFDGGSFNWKLLFQATFARIEALLSQHNYDVVILHCELFPLLPGWIERTFIRIPYIYDYDDAFYLKYRSGRLAIANPLLGKKFDQVMQGAFAVTAGNHILAEYSKQHNKKTQFFPTVVDTERYIPETERRGGAVLTIGWIGSPSTALYLSELVEPLTKLGEICELRLIVIGGKCPKILNVEIVEIPWREHTEVELINSFDIGVMPLPDEEWARGKCAFKLIQYMACAVPVIASPVGANIKVVNSSCGLLASTSQEWMDALLVLRNEPAKRVEMGLAGRKRVEEHYSLQRNLPKLTNVIREAYCNTKSII